jgi:phosphotriesterase-related protein
VVDCTPPGYGRDLDLLAQLSRTTGVRLVASTGSFCEQWHPQPAQVSAAPVDVLAERFVGELQHGACGVIKVATSRGAITKNEEKLLIAAATAHRRTGAPIVSHTTDGMGLEQLELYAAEGVAMDAVVVSHVCSGNEPFDYALELAARGALVGLDRVGHESHDLDHWVRLIVELKRANLLRQVVLSHDSVQRFSGAEAIAGHTFSDPTVVTTQLVPALERAGLTEGETHLMTHDNPSRWLLREGGPR